MPNGKKYSELSWAEWKGEIANKVGTIDDNQSELFKLVGDLREKMAFIQGRAAAYGAASGAVVAIILFLVKLFSDKV